MAYKGVLKDIEKCVKLQKPDRVPVFAMSEEFDVRIAGETYSNFDSDSKVMAKVIIDTVKRFDYDWAWLQIDDCIEFEILGVGVKGGGNILRATCDYLPVSYDTLKSLNMPNPKKDGRMPVLLDAIKRVKDVLGDTVCVVGRAAAPFSCVTLLYGMNNTSIALYDEPQLIKDTANFMTEMQISFGCAQIEAGANAIWFGDCNASGHLISVDTYNEFAFEGARKCVEAYDKAGGWSFYHASEHSPKHMQAQVATGISAISVGPGVDMAVAKRSVGDKCCIIGNVDPIAFLLYSTPEEVYAEIRRILEIGKLGGGYILDSGEMIPRDVPEENIKAMMRAGRDFGRY